MKFVRLKAHEGRIEADIVAGQQAAITVERRVFHSLGRKRSTELVEAAKRLCRCVRVAKLPAQDISHKRKCSPVSHWLRHRPDHGCLDLRTGRALALRLDDISAISAHGDKRIRAGTAQCGAGHARSGHLRSGSACQRVHEPFTLAIE